MRFRNQVLFAIWMMLALAVALSGCGNLTGLLNGSKAYGEGNNKNMKGIGPSTVKDKLNDTDPYGERPVQKEKDAAVPLPLLNIDGKSYVSLAELAKTLQFQGKWEESKKTFFIGDAAPIIEVAADSAKAVKADEPLHLSDPPIIRQQNVYLPVSSLADLLFDEMSFFVQGNQLVISPSGQNTINSGDPIEANAVSKEQLDFAEDSDDPYREVPKRSKIAGRKKADAPHLLQTAGRYKGIEYKFAADPYPKSGAFDSSSFTQYVFAKNGLILPRTARAQANWGTTVSRKKLRKGDLLFFNVPGTYKSDRTAGIAGIYLGNMEMICALPKTELIEESGVQIVNIDRPFWKTTFIRAKRAAFQS